MTLITSVNDYVIWTRNLHGDQALVERLKSLKAGETVALKIEGKRGLWRKMDNGKDGRPTLGLRPLGEAQQFWRSLYKHNRGKTVALEVEAPEAPKGLVRTQSDRLAAIAALLDPHKTFWISEVSMLDRDDLHQR
jgi:hypothetical protein